MSSLKQCAAVVVPVAQIALDRSRQLDPAGSALVGRSQSVCVGGVHPLRHRRQWCGGASGGSFVTAPADPTVVGEIITVLHSGSGGPIAPMVAELVTQADR